MRFAFYVVLFLMIQGCAKGIQKSAVEKTQTQADVIASPAQKKPNTLGFQPVKQMLSTNCSPCHNPGGKMYERLPFDDPKTVRAHSTGIAGRLDKPEDKKLLEEWLSEPQL
jgi:hypothetical protein